MQHRPLAASVVALFLAVAAPALAGPDSELQLIPQPVTVAVRACRPNVIRTLLAPHSADPGGVELLSERLKALGIHGAWRGATVSPEDRAIVVKSGPPGMSPQAYRLTVAEREVAIEASSGEGERNAFATLAQLVRPAGGGRSALPCVRIEDAPAMRWRILSDDVSRGPLPTLHYFEERIRTIAAFKMNGYSPYMEHVFVDPRHPLPAPLDGITPAELRELDAYARRFHVALIPEQQTFAHMHETLKYETYAALAELPHGYLLSPARDGSAAYTSDLIHDELEAVPHPPFFHIGSDEPSDLGRGASADLIARLGDGPVYTKHVVDTASDVIRSSGARPMIWDDALSRHPELFASLPKALVFVNWHYGTEPSYAPYIARIAQGGFDQMVAPGAMNWNEIYPDSDVALGNIGRFVREGKAAHVLGLFQTVWHDDGETLFEATWYPVLYAAANAWEPGEVPKDRYAADFPWAFFATRDARYARDIADLAAARTMLHATGTDDSSDYLFWSDAFDPRFARVARTLDLSALRLVAEDAEAHLRLAPAPPMHANAARVLALAARRYDVLGREYQIAKEARYYYDDARSNAGGSHENLVYRGLYISKYLLWEQRDAMEQLEPLVRDAWEYEDRGSHEGSVLERYHRAAQIAISRADAIDAATRENYLRDKSLPSFDTVLNLPTPPPAAIPSPGAERESGAPVTLLSTIAIVAAFALCAGLMVARRLPALLAVPLMALAFAALAGAGMPAVASVLVDGAVRLAPVYVTVMFGALLSRVTIATGIAETIVAYAAELGGDRPIVLALVLSGTVAVLFTSLTGLGAIVMVGSIVLPILMTVGVARKTAATLFLLAFALGFIFNLSQWQFYTKAFGVERVALQPFSYVLAAIDAAVLVAFAVVQFRRTRGAALWAVALDDEPLARPRVPPLALLTPVLPIVLALVFSHVPAYVYLANPIVAFGIAAIFGVLTTKWRESIPTLTAAAIRGVEDVAPAVLLFVGIGMLLVATALPPVQAALAPLVAALAPRSAIAYVIVFGVCSPLALYRGPLNPFGVGIAIYTILAGMHVVPAIVLVAAIMAVVQVQNVCDPTNTQNVWVANFTGVHVDEILTMTLPYQVAVATAATLAIALFGNRLIGAAPGAAIPPAAAATLPFVGSTNAFRFEAAAAHPISLSLDPNVSADATDPPVVAPSPFPAYRGTPVPTTPALPAITPAQARALLESPASSRATFAIVAKTDPVSQTAAIAIASAIDRGWRGFHTVVVPEAETGDCHARAYAAVLRVGATMYHGAAGTTLASDLSLADCADWPVAEWHDQRDGLTAATDRDIAKGALDTLSRLRLWALEHQPNATHLYETGVADLGTSPTFFYTLFKTTDGQMRVYVRAGGPAWVAGMRTNDIVEKLDGKFWWEYGTFQTQQRAYDGVAHVYVIQQHGVDRTIALGAPYRG